MTKKDMAHISLHLDSAVAKDARIQAIKEGVSLKAWVTQAIMRQLGENQRFVAAALEEQLAAREPASREDGVKEIEEIISDKGEL